jgi:phage gpG-like protein
MQSGYSGSKEFNKKMRELMERVERAIPDLADMIGSEIGKAAVEYAKENIELGRDMADHSEHTPELTEKLSRGTRQTQSVLEESGRLKESIFLVDRIVTIDGVIIVLGSNVPYAAIHEEGFSGVVIPNIKKLKSIPARPFMKPGIERAIREAFRYGLEDRVRKSLSAAASKRNWKKFFK